MPSTAAEPAEADEAVSHSELSDQELTEAELSDAELTDNELTDNELTDDELTALALAADPDAGLAPDAVSLWELEGRGDAELLPSWYMPAPMRRSSSRWSRVVIGLVVAAFLFIDAAGLCSTYGWISLG